MKYGADSFKGISPRKRAKHPARKIARKQERRVARKECNEGSSSITSIPK